jgi:hypothetical protein
MGPSDSRLFGRQLKKIKMGLTAGPPIFDNRVMKIRKDSLTVSNLAAAPFRTGMDVVVVILAVTGLAVGDQPS